LKETAVQKLDRELAECKDKQSLAEPIALYLISKCNTDSEFAGKVEQENKSLKKCIDYVMDEARKKLNGKSGCLPDKEVYGMAETYYLLNITVLKDIESESKNTESIPSKPIEEKKEESIDEQVSIFDIVG